MNSLFEFGSEAALPSRGDPSGLLLACGDDFTLLSRVGWFIGDLMWLAVSSRFYVLGLFMEVRMFWALSASLVAACIMLRFLVCFAWLSIFCW